MRELSLKNCRLDGRYDIHELLGRGSYAEIFVARDILASPQSPHSLVVIKALNVFLQNDLDHDLEKTLVENFQNEAVALDRVRHPNIISRLGHGSARDLNNTIFHYLVLEYLPGGDLSKACRENNVNLQQALNYLEQICAGLGNAHKNNIIHRDIKPQNLLLTANRETVKIADFGVARLSQTDSPITRVGTNIFAPPEHSPMLSDDLENLTVTELTPAADIYSLAKSAYVLITCESPRFFANQPITELPFALRQKPWAKDLVEVLNRATQNDPRKRHQNVVEFWQDLSKIKGFAAAEEEGGRMPEVAVQTNSLPQAHVAKGYTSMAPQRPAFNTSRDLKLNNLSGSNRAPLVVPVSQVELDKNPSSLPGAPISTEPIIVLQPVKKSNKPLRRFAVFIILLGLFAGILYATHNYIRGRAVLPVFSNKSQNATANGDVFLRSTPGTGNAPIGIVTKNSRLKVVNSQDGWLEVDIIEQGNSSAAADSAAHGWVSGKYVDVKE